jgi:ABC-2 type transport system ATP-binding protein
MNAIVMNAIEASEVSKSFGAVEALSGVSLAVPAGTIFGLLGPNGAGKSTLLKILCGLQKADSGTVRILDRDLSSEPREVQERIGYVSQELSIYEDLSVRENLYFFAEAYGHRRATARELVRTTSEALNLESLMDGIAGTLSRGWQQRLSLACAMLHGPPLLLLDEPTAGLDPVARRQIWELLRSAALRGVTVFLTTHHLDEAERCDGIGYMDRGRVLLSGVPGQLMAAGGHDRLDDALVAGLQGRAL